MREESFSLQRTLEANFLNVELPPDAQMDEISIRVIENDCPDFLIPFKILNRNGETILKYKLINTVALEYSDRTVSKQYFVKLYRSLLTPFIKGGDWFLDYHNFCIDPKYIFLDRQGINISLIYIPEKSFRYEDAEILNFFKTLFTSFTVTDDAMFQIKLFKFFSEENVSLTDLYEILAEEEKSSVASVKKGQVQEGENNNWKINSEDNKILQSVVSENQSISMLNEAENGAKIQTKGQFLVFGQKNNSQEPVKNRGLFGIGGKKQKHSEGKHDIFSEIDQNIEGENAVEALFGKKAKKKEVIQAKGKINVENQQLKNKQSPVKNGEGENLKNLKSQQMSERSWTSSFEKDSMEDFEKTEVDTESHRRGVAYLELIESTIPGAVQVIRLDFKSPFITIGRESSDEEKPDIVFGREFSRIGRKHARIQKNGKGYIIIDLGSVNHTFLDGQMLIPNKPYALVDGGILSFTSLNPVKYRIHL